MKKNWFFALAWTVLWPFVHLFFPFRVVGLENVPEGAALICPNHASGWDPVLVALSMPRKSNLAVMAKDQLFRFPPLAWVFRHLGAFPVKRGGNDLTAMKTAIRSLQEGQRLLLFPEGTRVEKEGDTDVKGGAILIAVRTKTPIIPVYCGPKHKFLRRTTVVFGEPFYPQAAGRRPTAEESQQAAEELLHRIYALAEVSAWK